MRDKITILTVICFTVIFQFKAQSVVGFWKVTSVKVGEQTMTPVAKWFKINADGTAESGNGWTKNQQGTWSYKNGEFISESKSGIKDEFGAFKVSFSDSVMVWNREEEGMDVVVSLSKIQNLPMAPIDKLKGLWQLVLVKQEGENLLDYDPNQKQYLHLRPDFVYRMRGADGVSSRGIWHMNGHRPIFTLLDHNRAIEAKVFNVKFENGKLLLVEQKDGGMTFKYERIHKFPE